MEKEPKVSVGPLITTLEIPDGSAIIGKVYQRSYFRPFYFSNQPNPDLSGELFRYTNAYTGERYIHTIDASPLRGTPYPFFETKFDPERPERNISAGSVLVDDTVRLADANPRPGNSQNDVIPAGETDDTGLSYDDVSQGTGDSEQGAGQKPGNSNDNTDENKYGAGSPGNGVFDPNRPISADGSSSYDNERRASERGGGSNPFYNRDGFITLPSWLQWITWPLAILADAIFDGFGLTAAGKNLLLLLILGLVVYVLVKNGSTSSQTQNGQRNGTSTSSDFDEREFRTAAAKSAVLGLA